MIAGFVSRSEKTAYEYRNVNGLDNNLCFCCQPTRIYSNNLINNNVSMPITFNNSIKACF